MGEHWPVGTYVTCHKPDLGWGKWASVSNIADPSIRVEHDELGVITKFDKIGTYGPVYHVRFPSGEVVINETYLVQVKDPPPPPSMPWTPKKRVLS